MAAGLTQEELAQRSGLSVRALSDMERGRTARPFLRSVRLLADTLELSGSSRSRLLVAASGGSTESGDCGHGSPPEAGAGQRSWSVVPRQLPAGLAHFTGRGAELKLLADLRDQAADGMAAVISAIGGTVGVGKTALAIQFGHQSCDVFADGQLYVNLRGFGLSATPAEPGEALRRFLGALGVEPERIPAGLDAQAALYRSLLVGKRVLIILDNAADEQQVRPLLPGSPGCLTVITSRRQLAGLAAADEASLLTLDVLGHGEARDLLAARVGSDRVATEPGPADELVTRCACLPLAVAIAAARAAARPGLLLADLAAELRDASSRLDALDSGDPAASIRAVFASSYRNLSAPAAGMFRLLGIHPGPDISLAAAASLIGHPVRLARRALDELTRMNLVTPYAPGRYALHDLLRAYAAEQASTIESEADRMAAIRRVLDHYVHTAYTADRVLYPTRDPLTLEPPLSGVVSGQPAGYQEALAWFEAEHRVLREAVALGERHGFDGYIWQLSWSLATFLSRRGHWRDWASTQQTALKAARRLGDQAGQAFAHRSIGRACTMLGCHREASTHLHRALRLYRRLGDLVGQAHTLINLASVLGHQRQYRPAQRHCLQALDLYRAAEHRAWEGLALNNIGWFCALLGDFDKSVSYCQQALDRYRELGDRHGSANSWDTLGYVHYQLGQYADAIRCYRTSLEIFRETGDRYNQADVLAHLADTRQAAGHPEVARDLWCQALAILEQLNHPDARHVRVRLAELQGRDPSAARHRSDPPDRAR
jgi:tetratricopeptide (TPR) repeat protein